MQISLSLLTFLLSNFEHSPSFYTFFSIPIFLIISNPGPKCLILKLLKYLLNYPAHWTLFPGSSQSLLPSPSSGNIFSSYSTPNTVPFGFEVDSFLQIMKYVCQGLTIHTKTPWIYLLKPVTYELLGTSSNLICRSRAMALATFPDQTKK